MIGQGKSSRCRSQLTTSCSLARESSEGRARTPTRPVVRSHASATRRSRLASTTGEPHNRSVKRQRAVDRRHRRPRSASSVPDSGPRPASDLLDPLAGRARIGVGAQEPDRGATRTCRMTSTSRSLLRVGVDPGASGARAEHPMAGTLSNGAGSSPTRRADRGEEVVGRRKARVESRQRQRERRGRLVAQRDEQQRPEREQVVVAGRVANPSSRSGAAKNSVPPDSGSRPRRRLRARSPAARTRDSPSSGQTMHVRRA